MYSFGMVLWQLATRNYPFQNMKSWDVPTAVVKGVRPKLPKDLPQQFPKLIKSCWDGKPDKRPTANACMTSLSNILLSIRQTDISTPRRIPPGAHRPTPPPSPPLLDQ